MLQQSFGGYYATLFWWSSSWLLQDHDHDPNFHPDCALIISFGGTGANSFASKPINGPELYVMGFYVSTETITSVGFGDIVPRSAFTKIICGVEMFMGLFYAVFLVSGALEKFAKPASDSTRQMQLNELISEAQHVEKKMLVRWLVLRLHWVRFRDSKIVRGCRTSVRKVHVLVSLTVQFFAMLLLVVYRQNLNETPQGNNPLVILFFVFLLQVVLGCIPAQSCIK